MKKTLIALAVMSASAGAFAQSNVQIYGIVDAGVEHVSSGNVSTTKVGSGLQADSRIGFKGTEDLGSGLSAQFVLEQGFSTDTGAVTDATANAFGRQSWVGIESKNLGAVRLGRQNTPIRGIVEVVDPFALASFGNSLKVLGGGALAERSSNAVTYVSPNVAGFSGQIQYGMGETTQSANTNAYTGVSAAYANGPLLVGFAYANQKTDLTPADKKATTWILGGTYDLQVVKLHAAVAENKAVDNVASTTDKGRNYLLGVSAPFGPHTVMASYLRNDVSTANQSDTSAYSLGYTYAFSKRTNVYAALSHTANDANVALNGATAAGDNVNKYTMGVRHQF